MVYIKRFKFSVEDTFNEGCQIFVICKFKNKDIMKGISK